MSKEKDQKITKRFSRRKFLKRGGIILGGTAAIIYFARSPIRRTLARILGEMNLPSGVFNFEPDFWFEVTDENIILLKSPKVEMGQGIFTGFAMLAAEELEVTLDQIKVVPGSTLNSSSDLAGTGGSSSTGSLYIPIREVAATLREMLKLSAAQLWNTPIDTIEARAGYMISGEHNLSYSAIVQKTTDWKIPESPALKPSTSFRYVGSEQKRVDLADKVMAKPLFGIDQEFPEMVYAMTLECPFIEGRLVSIDKNQAEKQPGVLQIIQEKDLIAVVAKTRYAAEMGKRKLIPKWDVPKLWQQKDIDERVTVGNGHPINVQKEGNPNSIFSNKKDEIVKSEYRSPLGVHAQMEVNGALAFVEVDKATIIMGTQYADMVQTQVASATGLSKKKVEIRNTFLGGGFGRRYHKNKAVYAARISKIINKPVFLFRDREEEFLNGYFRPSNHHVMQAVISNGKIEAIAHEQATGDMILDQIPIPGMRTLLGADYLSAGHGTKIIYEIPHRSADMYDIKFPFQTGIWRGVGAWLNAFPIECFMDEMANQLNIDPIELRLQYLQSNIPLIKRLKTALETLRDKSGWLDDKPADVGRGFACAEDRKTLTAAVVEVKLINNKIRVTRVINVIDPGIIINPEGVRMQVEGSVMMGISAALYEGTYIKDGQFTATNYHEYPMAMLSDTPEIEVILLEGADEPSGVGEPPIAPIAPAIANAIFNLTGERIRELPLIANMDI